MIGVFGTDSDKRYYLARHRFRMAKLIAESPDYEIQYLKYCLPAFIAGSPYYGAPKKQRRNFRPEVLVKLDCSST